MLKLGAATPSTRQRRQYGGYTIGSQNNYPGGPSGQSSINGDLEKGKQVLEKNTEQLSSVSGASTEDKAQENGLPNHSQTTQEMLRSGLPRKNPTCSKFYSTVSSK